MRQSRPSVSQLPPSSGPARLRWVDVAKGLTMLLVVLAHVVGKHYLRLEWTIDAPIRGAWREVSDVFLPLRMPLFFLLSGFLAASTLTRPVRSALLRRVAKPYLLYLVWFAINAVVLVGFGFTEPEGLLVSPAGLVRSLVFPVTTLWYMLALAAFFLVALAVRGLGALLPIAAALALSVAVHAEAIILPAWTGMTPSMLVYCFAFLGGALAPGMVRRLAELGMRTPLWLPITAYAVVATAFRLGGARVPGLATLGAALGAGLGVMISVRLADWDAIAGALAFVGRRTLPIFVLHVPVLAIPTGRRRGLRRLRGSPCWPRRRLPRCIRSLRSASSSSPASGCGRCCSGSASAGCSISGSGAALVGTAPWRCPSPPRLPACPCAAPSSSPRSSAGRSSARRSQRSPTSRTPRASRSSSSSMGRPTGPQQPCEP